MLLKIRLILQCLVISLFYFACSKHDNPPAVVPELLDTLGTGWQRIKIDTTLNFEDVFFVNNQTGFLCGDQYLGKSTNGGLTWSRIIPDSLNQSFVNLFFLDANNGWVTGDHFLLRTIDAGASWVKVHYGKFFDVQFLDINNGYLTSSTDAFFKTTDGGVTTTRFNTIAGSRALFFQDINKGWITSSSNVFETEDGGSSFVQKSGVDGGAYAIQFIDDLNGWIGGLGSIYRTTDAGSTLFGIATGSTPGGDISFFDKNNGFVLAHNIIYSTADGGQTLTKVCKINKASLIEIHFTDPNHGWATGSGGYVYRYVKP